MKAWMLALIAVFIASARAQVADLDLARRLADLETRQKAIEDLLPSGRDKIPVLSMWTWAPPPEVDEYELRVGLAEAFGRFKTQDAIPFLIKNLTLRRSRYVDFAPWLKVAESVEGTFPAIVALIRIGPEGSRAAMKAYKEPMDEVGHLAAVFVVSRIPGVREARRFLKGVIMDSDSKAERYRAAEGIEYLSENP
jgi:hypothetical protein